MSSDFDFNINNYTIPDIENFLGLNQDYTFNDVMKRKQNMVTIIIDKEISWILSDAELEDSRYWEKIHIKNVDDDVNKAKKKFLK